MRVYIFDREPLCQLALEMSLVGAGHEVVGQGNRDQCLNEIISLRPDVVVVDCQSFDAAILATLLESCLSSTKIIIWTDDTSSAYASQALNSGAHGLVCKSVTCWDLFPAALNSVVAGVRWVDAAIAANGPSVN